MKQGISELWIRINEHLKIPLFRNSYALIASAGSTAILGVVYWMIAARLYPNSIVGVNSSLFSVITLLAGLSLFNLRGLVITYLPRLGASAWSFVLMVYLTVAIGAFIICIIYVFLASRWSLELSSILHSDGFWVWFVLATIVWNIFIMQDHIITGLRKTVIIPVENTIFSIAKLVLLVLSIKLIPTLGIFVSWIFAMFLTVVVVNFLIFTRYLPSHINANQDNSYKLNFGHVIRFVVTDYLGALVILGSTTLLPVLVTQILGSTANAYFYMPWTISNSLAMVGIGISASLTVESAGNEAMLVEYTTRTIRNTLKVLVPSIIGVIIFAPLLLSFFGADYVREGTSLIQLLALAMFPNSLIAIWVSIARVQGELMNIFMPTLFVSLTTLMISLIFLPSWGIISIGIALLLSQSVTLVALMTQQSFFRDAILSILKQQSH